MAWQDKLIPMLRVMINDMSNTPTYTDDRLESLLGVAAHYVKEEIHFSNSYTVTIDPPDIDPDPSVTATQDDAFCNLVVLKAACLADIGLYRSKALLSGLKARCGPAVLETVQHLPGFKELLTLGPCAAYEKLKLEWSFGNAQVCRAILSPFVSNEFDPASLAGVSSSDYR